MAAIAAIIPAIRHDLRTLLAGWRGILFERQLTPHPVTGEWRPTTPLQKLTFWTWTAIGIPLIAIVYPLAVLGFGTRYVSRKLDWVAGALGLLMVLVTVAIAWSALTLVAYFQFSTTGFQAVLAASVVATISAGLSWVFAKIDGWPVSILFAYPFGVAAVVLPPVTAALFSPTLGDLILTESDSLAVWLLDNVLSIRDLDEFLRREFTLTNVAYLGMWFGLSVPVGWLLGILVTLANAVRPSAEEDEDGDD